jgi:3-dehydroquinate synthase
MTARAGVNDPVTINVALGARAYDIVVGRGQIATLGARIAALRPGARTAILTDRTVARHWLDAAKASLAAADIPFLDIVVGEGEASKTYAVFEKVCEALIAGRIERNDLLIALGGGVIGDLGGFAASVLRRGVDFVQVPTTLLAQVDSSVGGKTGINSPQGKNLIGSFHQPALVVADTATLDTLPPRQFRAGYAEIVKYGLLGDAEFFSWLEASRADIFAGGPAREQAIAASCRAKAAVVARDERETGDRALLNLGHTFGHVFEAATGFSDRLYHGEGVGLGMALAAEFSAELGLLPREQCARIIGHLAEAGLPTHVQSIPGFAQEGLVDADGLMQLMAQDKKVKRGRLTFILLRRIGEAFIANDVEAGAVRDFLHKKLSERA